MLLLIIVGNDNTLVLLIVFLKYFHSINAVEESF